MEQRRHRPQTAAADPQQVRARRADRDRRRRYDRTPLGPKISARGIYRDSVRSSHGHFVKTSGLRWLAVMAMVPAPWTKRRWGLPFLTVLAPSERYDAAHRRRHKKLTDFARQAIL